ncbi:MAG: sigma-70 family RNA polymerase sigma factor [Mesorhizobium sp.]|nr:sigma-70 family RNA polymerase sigma factor [Mesorhizobium sp.]
MPSPPPKQAPSPAVAIFARTSRDRSAPSEDGSKPLAGAPDGGTVLSEKVLAARFAEVVLPHLGDALSLARWLTGNTADAEDVVQEACLKAHAGIAGFSGGNARAWLLTIVRNASYTWMARNRPRAVVAVGDLADLDDVSPLPDNDADSPEAALIAKANTAAVEAAIAGLPEAFRETVVLRDINVLSYREIATMLGVPQGTVMSRLARARGLLMMELGGRHHEPA